MNASLPWKPWSPHKASPQRNLETASMLPAPSHHLAALLLWPCSFSISLCYNSDSPRTVWLRICSSGSLCDAVAAMFSAVINHPSSHAHKISMALRKLVSPSTLGHQTPSDLLSSFLSSVHGYSCLVVCLLKRIYLRQKEMYWLRCMVKTLGMELRHYAGTLIIFLGPDFSRFISQLC